MFARLKSLLGKKEEDTHSQNVENQGLPPSPAPVIGAQFFNRNRIDESGSVNSFAVGNQGVPPSSVSLHIVRGSLPMVGLPASPAPVIGAQFFSRNENIAPMDIDEQSVPVNIIRGECPPDEKEELRPHPRLPNPDFFRIFEENIELKVAVRRVEREDGSKKKEESDLSSPEESSLFFFEKPIGYGAKLENPIDDLIKLEKTEDAATTKVENWFKENEEWEREEEEKKKTKAGSSINRM